MSDALDPEKVFDAIVAAHENVKSQLVDIQRGIERDDPDEHPASLNAHSAIQGLLDGIPDSEAIRRQLESLSATTPPDANPHRHGSIPWFYFDVDRAGRIALELDRALANIGQYRTAGNFPIVPGMSDSLAMPERLPMIYQRSNDLLRLLVNTRTSITELLVAVGEIEKVVAATPPEDQEQSNGD